MEKESPRKVRRSPQAELIADRSLFMIRDRWPLIFNSLTPEALSSMRAIIANDVNCLLKAMNGDAKAIEAWAQFEGDWEKQKKADEERSELLTTIIENRKQRFGAQGKTNP